MAERGIIMMRQKELRYLHVIHKVLEGEITQGKAAELVSLSERQIRRIVKRIREQGDEAIAHRARGRQSNRKKSEKLRERIIVLYRNKYKGFGPTLASEKMLELDGLHISDETLRLWLIDEGEWQGRRASRKHRQWRPRKEHYGEMLQMDGSHHDWFEGRGPKCVLVAYIDDATGRVFGRFYEYEGTIPAMDSFKQYIRRYGLPLSVYLDKHPTYKSWAKLTDEDIMAGRQEPLSQFERALGELGVQVIHANSPQAKGRVERLFRTLQDRLIKEMRLHGIGTITEANKFLKYYLPVYNKKFARKPQKGENLHRVIQKGVHLDKMLCIKTERTIRNDNTIAHNKELYQIEENIKTEKVIVEDRINGRMVVTHKGNTLKFRKISERPEKEVKVHLLDFRKRRCPVPASHPWKNIRSNADIEQTRWKQAMANARV